MTPLESLIEKAKGGHLALLVGPELPRAVSGLPPASEIARGLAAAAGVNASPSLVAVGERLKHQPWRYSQYLAQTLDSEDAPGPLHHALAALPIPHFLTTSYDDCLERALVDQGRTANLLVEDDDLAERKGGRPDLLKLCGDLARAATLVVTEEGYRALPDQTRLSLFEQVGEWVARHSFLLVGCDPTAGSDFERWCYGTLLRPLGGFAEPSYLLWPDPVAPNVAAQWAARNVTVVQGETLTFVETLGAALAGQEWLAEEPQEATLRALLRVLRGTPTPQAVGVALADVPVAERPQAIRLSLRLSLGGDDTLHSLLDIDYTPSISHFHGSTDPSGLTLEELSAWANDAEELLAALAPPDGSPVQTKGAAFFDRLVPPGSMRRKQYEMALRDCALLSAALEVVVELQDATGRLSPVPWELLFDQQVAQGRGFLGLSYPIYRLPDSVSTREQVTGKLKRALIVAADPTFLLQALEQEVAEVKGSLEAAGVTQVDVRSWDHADVSDPAAIRALLRDGRYDLFHFVGHAFFDASDPAQSYLLLGRDGEQDKRLTAADLARVTRDSRLILVFLSACSVGLTAGGATPWAAAGMVDALTRSGVPAVVGMRWRVGDANAHTIARQFYAALRHGHSAQHALMVARQALQPQPDWINPLLTKRHGVLDVP